MIWFIAYILAHEGGHALIATLLGNPPRGLTLGIGPWLGGWGWLGLRAIPLGFSLGYRSGNRRIALAGPLGGLLVALTALACGAVPMGIALLADTALQLLPFKYFDGSRIWRVPQET